MAENFRGTYTVMVTPFSDDGSVDARALAALTEWQIREGIHGLIPLGSTGEFLSLSQEERSEVAETGLPWFSVIFFGFTAFECARKLFSVAGPRTTEANAAGMEMSIEFDIRISPFTW